jgi:mRNA-degrading endonuclease YafQ of YafQ-DinJ toxin-antitoxin module
MIKELSEEKEAIFREDPFDHRLRTHKLKGGLGRLYSFSINNKYRIMFELISDDHAYFHTIGNHDIYE